jgi:hypothetical protein
MSDMLNGVNLYETSRLWVKPQALKSAANLEPKKTVRFAKLIKTVAVPWLMCK